MADSKSTVPEEGKSFFSKIDFFELLICPLKYKVILIIINSLIIAFVLGILILSKILSPEVSFLPDLYLSRAKVLIPENQSSNLNFDDIGNLAGNIGLNVSKRVSTTQVVISILESNTVLDGVIDELFLEKKPMLKEAYENGELTKQNLRNIVLSNAYFRKDEQTGFLLVSYHDINPVVAKEMVEYFLIMLNRATYNFALTQTSFKRKFIEERIEEINDKLIKAKKEYLLFQQEHGIISPTQEAIEITNTIAALRAELINKEAELENYYRTHQTGAEDYSQLGYDVFNLKQKIRRLTVGDEDGSDDLILSKKRISELSMEFTELKTRVDNYKDIYTSLLNELELIQIQEKSEGAMIQVIDPPEVSSRKFGPSRSKILFQAIIIVLFLSICTVIGIEFFKLYIWTNEFLKEKILIVLSYLRFRKKNMKKTSEK
ncbi:MAG: hypothetical protein MJB14_17135 [Spirochaetes bacterium]|nr:hypothetical protein [Spirochaetota bacterium]